MADTSQISRSGGGFAKASLGALYMDFCQHITPPLAGYLNMRFPLLGENLSFEIIVFAQSTLAAVIIKITPNYILDSVIDAIVWIKTAWKKIRSAADQP